MTRVPDPTRDHWVWGGDSLKHRWVWPPHAGAPVRRRIGREYAICGQTIDPDDESCSAPTESEMRRQSHASNGCPECMLASVYPAHWAVRRAGGANQTVGNFLEWLRREGYVIARWREDIVARDSSERKVYTSTRRYAPQWGQIDPGNGVQPVSRERPYGTMSSYRIERRPVPAYADPAYVPVDKSLQDWIAEFFGIDRDAYDRELGMMLEEIRNVQTEATP